MSRTFDPDPETDPHQVLTPVQLACLKKLVRQICKSPSGCGNIKIVVRHHRPRFIVPAVSLDLPG